MEECFLCGNGGRDLQQAVVLQLNFVAQLPADQFLSAFQIARMQLHREQDQQFEAALRRPQLSNPLNQPLLPQRCSRCG